MKYAFVTLGILAVWISIVSIVAFLDYNEVTLPIIGLFMTLILFIIGFGANKWDVLLFYHF